MASSYGVIKKIYRTLVPNRWRITLGSKSNPFGRWSRKFKARLEKNASNEEIYDRHYFESQIEGSATQSAPIIAEYIAKVFKPVSVIDVGCGPGALLQELGRAGIQCVGLEYADAAIEMARQRGIDVRKMDLEQEIKIEGKWSLAISTEVAEHLPERCANHFVDLLTKLSDRILVTAATPGQGGTDHVNEQPNQYWIEKFVQRGFRYNEVLTLQTRGDWMEKGTTYFYYTNLMIFESSAGADQAPHH
jgi:SAM-dependent methyltransferase